MELANLKRGWLTYKVVTSQLLDLYLCAVVIFIASILLFRALSRMHFQHFQFFTSFLFIAFKIGYPTSAVKGQLPLGQLPLGQLPWGQLPRGQLPHRTITPIGQLPWGQLPPGQLPPGQLPPRTITPVGQLPLLVGQLPLRTITPLILICG